MDPLEVLISIGIVSVVLIIVLVITAKLVQRKDDKIIACKMREFFDENQLHFLGKKSSYQVEIETTNILYLIKIVKFNPKSELIITNPHYWCVNQNIKNWKRSATPVLVEGVKAFQDLSIESAKKIVKVGLIYPNCYNITRYLNESDVEIVTYKKNAYGVFFVRFSEIELFFKI